MGRFCFYQPCSHLAYSIFFERGRNVTEQQMIVIGGLAFKSMTMRELFLYVKIHGTCWQPFEIVALLEDVFVYLPIYVIKLFCVKFNLVFFIFFWRRINSVSDAILGVVGYEFVFDVNCQGCKHFGLDWTAKISFS